MPNSSAGRVTGLVLATCLLAVSAPAQFAPIPLTADSYNADVVVEKGAPPPLLPATTASMEGGAANTGLGWYERGYYAEWPATGLPQAGALLEAEYAPDHLYAMPPDYKSPNALLLDSGCVTGSFTLATGRVCAAVSFLAGSAAGPVTLGFTIRHADGSAQSGTFSPPNWVDGPMPAWTAAGRIDVREYTISGVNGRAGRLFPNDVAVANALSPVTRIDFSHVSGTGHAAVFALSAAAEPNAGFEPVMVTGYSHDLVVEAKALRRGALTATTATLDTGTENRLYTLYERGYVAPLPASGLPAPGAFLECSAHPAGRFALAPDYTLNNAVVVDSRSPAAVLAPASPAPASALVLLAASSRGPVTNTCAVQHADGAWETNAWVAPDYLGSEDPAYVADGRVDVGDRVADCLGEGRVRLFASVVPLSHTQSPVVGIVLRFGGPVGSACTVLAVSGVTPGATRPTLALRPNPDGSLTLSTSGPGFLESAEAPEAAASAWRSEGAIAGTARIAPAPNEPRRFYRVRVE